MSSGAGPLRGDIANLYQFGPGLLKFVRNPADNDLMRQEATALTQLRDAWRLLAEFDELLERLYGPRTYRPFAMPA